jgi:perosamine synthetase
VCRTLRSGWLTSGKVVARLERDFAAYLGAKHAVAVCSGTAALHLALEAIGLKPADEVVVPTFTFTATAEVVTYFGARPVLIDSRAEDFNLDPAAFEAAITKKTKAVIPVHIGGLPCRMDAIRRIARRHDIAVIEDAAHCVPGKFRGRPVGLLGDAAAFSLYANKNITSAEGGVLVTQSSRIADRARVMRLHGMDRDAWRRYAPGGSWRYDIVAAGFKYNLTDVHASIAVHQLDRADALWRDRAAIARAYDAAFSLVPELKTPPRSNDSEHAWHLYSLRIIPEKLRVGRDAFFNALRAENIGLSVHFIPLHLMSYYRTNCILAGARFPNADRHFESLVSLPIYSGMSRRDVSDVITAVQKVVTAYRR